MSDTLIEGSMPAVDPDVIAQASGASQSTEAPASPQETQIVTPSTFDPVKHETNPDGTPRLKADGTPRLKRGQAKIKLKLLPSEGSVCNPPSPAGASSAPAGASQSVTSSPVKPPPTPEQIAASAAKWGARYWMAMGMMFGEKHGKPEDMEATLVDMSLQQTFRELQATPDLPWYIEVSLALAYPVYARLNKPEVRADLIAKRGKTWFGRLIARWLPVKSADPAPADAATVVPGQAY